MKGWMIAAGALALAAGEPAGAQEASPAQQALLRCYMGALPKFEDGISDARTIAGALVAVCRAELRATTRPGGGMTVDQIMQQTQPYALDGAAAIVLRERVRKRTPAP